jgi:hypothetical protein
MVQIYIELEHRTIECLCFWVQMLPLFLGLVLAEYLGLWAKGKGPRLQESLNSLAHGIIAEAFK